MAWQRRDSSTLVVLGNGGGEQAKAFGLLAAITEDEKYEGRKRYELVQQDGSSTVVAGSVVIDRHLSREDVGKFVELEFLGWGQGSRGRYKRIAVQVLEHDSELPEELKDWPRYKELNGNRGATGATEPLTREAQADDLPF